MDYKNAANKIYKLVGGKENINYVTHCMTRLRFGLKDDKVAKTDEIKQIDGVKGVMIQGGQYQIIIGSDVGDLYKELPAGIKDDAQPVTDDTNKKLTIKDIGNNILGYISASVTGALSVIIGCGMLKLLLVILDLFKVQHGFTYNIITIMGNAGFYFLPAVLAYTSAKKLRVNPAMAIAVSTFLIDPDLIKLLAQGNVTFLKLPVYSTTYASSIIPPLLATWALSIVSKLVDKITPKWSKAILDPMLTLLITIPLVLVVFGPIGAIIGQDLSIFASAITKYVPWLTMGIVAAFLPLLVLAGIHHAFDPIYINSFAKVGYDAWFLPMMLAMNFSITASTLVVALKTKEEKTKSIAYSSAVSAGLAGITEPGLFGVLLTNKRALISSMIGSGIGGALVGLFHVKIFAAVSPGAISMISFFSNKFPQNLMFAIIVAIVSFVSSFAITWFSYSSKQTKVDNSINSPIKGELIPLSEVKDATFADKLLGDGFAVKPIEGKVYSPVDGTVEVMYKTGHAIGLKSNSGQEILIHVGLDTVKLNGKGFSPKVKQDTAVKKGQLLLTFDLEGIKKQGYDLTTPVIITSMGDAKSMEKLKSTGVEISHNTPIIKLA